MENGKNLLLTQTETGEIRKRRITDEELGKIFFNDGDREWDNVQTHLPAPVCEKLYEDGILVYEGCTVDHKAFGPGRTFFQDGRVHEEGIFGIKGLLLGREYYPNGKIRFEGTLRLNQGYGPNIPEFGSWYDDSGTLKYHGEFRIHRSSLGYPFVTVPENFGAVPKTQLKDHIFMWEDARKYLRKEEE